MSDLKAEIERRRAAKLKKRLELPPIDTNTRYTIDEAIELLRTSRSSIYNLISSGELRVLREGKRTYCPGSELIKRSRLPESSAA